MIAHPDFPRLTSNNHRVTSPATTDYNCIAWSAQDTAHWWRPGLYWPVALPEDQFGLGALEQAFLHLGYQRCADGSSEDRFEKVALYGSESMYAHAARQLPNGRWTSKLGSGEDIEHDAPANVGGGLYGEVVQFMKRHLVKPPTG
jgi:hypothetical protein